MSNTLVIAYIGQSNGVGKNSSTGGAGNGAPFYTSTNVGIRVLKWNGHLSSNGWNAPISDPWADPTDAIDGLAHSLRIARDPLSSLGTCSAIPFADNLKTAGRTENIILVPGCLASTYVGADWKDTGGFNSVASYSTNLGIFKRRISIAMRAPNSRLLVVMCGGESEAADGNGDHPDTTLVTDLGTVLDSINTEATNKSWTWDKSKHFLIYQVAAGYASAPMSWPRTTQTRAAFTTIGARSDVLLVSTDAVFPGTWTHKNKAEQIACAGVASPLYMAAT